MGERVLSMTQNRDGSMMQSVQIETEKISRTLMRRLPIYLAHLKSLPEEEDNISATTIARNLGMGHVMVRKDLAKISVEGRCRTGRSRKRLIQDIEGYLEFCSDFPKDSDFFGCQKQGKTV